MPVVSQSIMKPMVPVGASTVTCEFLKPCFSPSASASSQSPRGHEQFRLHVFGLDAAHGIAMHADHVQHRFAVHGISRERPHLLGNRARTAHMLRRTSAR